MIRRIPAVEARQRFGTLLDEVRLRDDEVVIERDGKPAAVMVSLETYKRYQELRERAREEAFAYFQSVRDELAEKISEAELEQLIEEASEEVRRERKSTKTAL
jgi:prevent-host-death family protein